MGKLGKKARKFARKNLQSVMRQRRKFKSMRDSSRRRRLSGAKNDTSEDHVVPASGKFNTGNYEGQITDGADDISLDVLFEEEDDSSIDDASESDGYLSEDAECPYLAGSDNEDNSKEIGSSSELTGQNREAHLELDSLKKKLERLKKKDPKFSMFLEARSSQLNELRGDVSSSDEEDEISEQHGSAMSSSSNFKDGKVLTSSTVDAWCQLVMEKQNMSILPNLLNGYKAACNYGSDGLHESSCQEIPNKKAFSKILMFVLRESDGIFRKILGIKTSCKKETILELKSSSKWMTVKPLLKLYLRCTLHLLHQATDWQILEFTLSRLRTSIVFFAAFLSLLRKFIKVAVHLWATGGDKLSVSSFLAIRDMALGLGIECLDSISSKLYRTFIVNCKFVEPTNLKHIQFLGDSAIEIFSIDIQVSSKKALASVRHIARILQLALRTKRKDALKKIYNWQYINCIDLWVKFISINIRDHDLQPLLYLVIQIISGVAHLFTGPRYLPLRLKCIQMLNQLSGSSGVFIPIASLILCSLEYKCGKITNERPVAPLNFSSVLKVPKYLLKSQSFQEECIISAVELLSAHFAQWSYHISFPELAIIPLIRLKTFCNKITVESLRCRMKRLIEQVEQNVLYVQKKREDVPFSPKDQTLADSFLQLEKNGKNAPFPRYYERLVQKSISRNVLMNKTISKLEGTRKRQRVTRKT